MTTFTLEALNKTIEYLNKPYVPPTIVPFPTEEEMKASIREIKDIMNIQAKLDRTWALASMMK